MSVLPLFIFLRFNIMNEIVEHILQSVTKTTGVTLQDLQSKKRDHKITRVRFVASYLLYTLAGETVESIGRILNTHYSTVIYHRQKVEDAIDGFDTKVLNVFNAVVAEANISNPLRMQVSVLVKFIYKDGGQDLIEILKKYIEQNEGKKTTPAELRQVLGH